MESKLGEMVAVGRQAVVGSALRLIAPIQLTDDHDVTYSLFEKF